MERLSCCYIESNSQRKPRSPLPDDNSLFAELNILYIPWHIDKIVEGAGRTHFIS